MRVRNTKLARAFKFLGEKARLCFTISDPVMLNSFVTALCIAALAPMAMVISPVSSMSNPASSPSISHSAASSLSTGNLDPVALTARPPRPPPPINGQSRRCSAESRRVHPANLDEDYYGYWNPEPYDGIGGSGLIPH